MDLFKAKEKKQQFEALKAICMEYESNRERFVNSAEELYDKRKNGMKHLEQINDELASFQNIPDWYYDDVQEAFDGLKDFKQAVDYETKPHQYAEETASNGKATAFLASGGVAAGTAVATLGPTAAMSIATVLGTASTGTAISALTGVAATNAALAWLGGGTIAAGGAGIAGGSLFLGFLGPVGAAIAGVSAISGMAVITSKNKKLAAEARKQIDQIQHDLDILKSKNENLTDLICRTENFTKHYLEPSIKWAEVVAPKDYSQWGDLDKHKLERLINSVTNMVQLINSRV